MLPYYGANPIGYGQVGFGAGRFLPQLVGGPVQWTPKRKMKVIGLALISLFLFSLYTYLGLGNLYTNTLGAILIMSILLFAFDREVFYRYEVDTFVACLLFITGRISAFANVCYKQGRNFFDRLAIQRP